jgi:protoporphyrinogen oxidase
MFLKLQKAMSYRFLKYFALIISALYCSVAVYTNTIYPGSVNTKELYPFFSWFLFAYIPNPSADYTIELISFDKETYPNPLPFKEMRFIFKEIKSGSSEYTHIIRLLGSAVIRHDEEAVKMFRQKLEKIFLDSPATYEIFTTYTDPVSLWKTGVYREKRSLRVFEYKPK